MSRCANTEALDKYLDEQEIVEAKYERVEKRIRDDVDAIKERIARIKAEFENEELEYDEEFVNDALS